MSGLLGAAFKLTIKTPELPTLAPAAPEGTPIAIMAENAPNLAHVLSALLTEMVEDFNKISVDMEIELEDKPEI